MPPVREALSRIMVLKLPKVQNPKVQVAPAVKDGTYQGFQDVTSQPMGTVYWKPGVPRFLPWLPLPTWLDNHRIIIHIFIL